MLQSNIQKVLGLEIEKVPGARLAQVKLLQKQDKTIAWVVIRTPKNHSRPKKLLI
jgi:hypothetical protein